jgi:hypothetical protein
MTSCPDKPYEERHYGLMNSALPIAQVFGLYQPQNFLLRRPRQWASGQTALPPVG